MSFDGIVLAGGAGRRLGGIDKPALAVGDRQLLDIALGALDTAESIIVVGPTIPTKATSQPVRWTREDPPGGGPVAALATALPLVTAAAVVVLAADLPFVTATAIARLRSARGSARGVVAVDADGRDQLLVACYDTAALREAIPSPAAGASMRSVLRGMQTGAEVRRVDLGGDPPVVWDCDTPSDLMRAKELT
jgi:molybdopterin-guanine dinucleotide biosynthesis protein A